MVAIGSCCSATHSNPTTEGSSKRPGKVDSCLIFSEPAVATSKAQWYLFGFLKYPLLRESMARIYGASGLVTIGCFCHLFHVRFTSDNDWDPSVTPEIQMCSAPLHPDGVRVHCTLLSTKIKVKPIVHFLRLAGGRPPPFPIRAFIT